MQQILVQNTAPGLNPHFAILETSGVVLPSSRTAAKRIDDHDSVDPLTGLQAFVERINEDKSGHGLPRGKGNDRSSSEKACGRGRAAWRWRSCPERPCDL
jgi:hypothetical protein